MNPHTRDNIEAANAVMRCNNLSVAKAGNSAWLFCSVFYSGREQVRCLARAAAYYARAVELELGVGL